MRFVGCAVVVLVVASSPCLAKTTAKCTTPDDCTDDLQHALDQPGEVVVPNLTHPWFVRPLFLRTSNQLLTLEPGVEIYAKEGEFHAAGDCLMKADKTAPLSNVTIIGYGATLRMRKLEYADRKNYVYSEWRHGLSLSRVNNVSVYGLTVKSTGGDGLYVDDNSENIFITEVLSDDNWRQGMSVICATNLLVTRSNFTNTNGTAPQAGVDLEPDEFTQVMKNVTFKQCRASGNTGCGFQIWLAQFNLSTAPVSVTFEDFVVDGTGQVGHNPRGFIKFTRGTVHGAHDSGIRVWQHPSDSHYAHITLDNITVSNCSTTDGLSNVGGVSFNNITVTDSSLKTRPFISLDCSKPPYASEVDGSFSVYTPTGDCTADLGPDPAARHVGVQYSCHKG